MLTAVDAALEQLLRTRLPLPEDLGDVSFDAPESSWGAQLSRVTVNLFMFDVARSPQPSRPMQERVRPDGRVERRAAMPMVRLSYLVTAWAGNTRDEHQLLGDALACLLPCATLPAEHFAEPPEAPVQLGVGQNDARLHELWSTLGGRLRPAFQLDATVVFDTSPWQLAAPPVERVAGLVAPRPTDPGTASSPRTRAATVVRRERDGGLVRELRRDEES